MNLADGHLRLSSELLAASNACSQGRRAEGEVPGGGTAGRLAPPQAPTRQTVFALPGLGTASPYEPLRAESADGLLSACIRFGRRGRGAGNMGPGDG